MRNPGELCYRNGALQALLHMPKFINWIEDAHPVCSIPQVPDCVACALHRLSTVYWGVGNVEPALAHFWTVAQHGEFLCSEDHSGMLISVQLVGNIWGSQTQMISISGSWQR